MPKWRIAVVFFEPEESRFDLRWRMLGTPIRVHPWFWLVNIILGWDGAMRAQDGGFPLLFLWVGCVFVSILVHEFGHVLMGRLFGSHGSIVLYGMGGLAIGSNSLSRRWQRVLVLLAGPGAELLLLAVFLGLVYFFGPHVSPEWLPYLGWMVTYMIWINLFWGLLNLLPIWPLDGGQILRELSMAVMPSRGLSFSLGISMVVSGLLAAHCFMASQNRPLIPFLKFGSMFMAFFFLMFCISSFSALQAESERHRRWDHDEWT
jgi:stage IV sporulation protein FB